MNVEDISQSDLIEAYGKLKDFPHICYTTPVIQDVQQQLKEVIPDVNSLALKLETMQYTGSFKARGTAYQFIRLSDEHGGKKHILVTMSAGNYGKAFAHMCKEFKMPGVVYMPDSALLERQTLIESLGSTVHRCPVNQLFSSVEKHQHEHGSLFLHSYDDPILFIGHASAGLELVEQLSHQPDVVVVCCGGGGFLSGVALGLKLSGWASTKVYGVEPEKGPSMYNAVKAGKLVPTELDTTCIATGLMPPTAGSNAFKVVQKYVEEIILVSDEEMVNAISVLYKIGLVVEPSGAAAFAAVLAKKIPDLKHKDVCVFLTGSNISVGDLQLFLNTVNK